MRRSRVLALAASTALLLTTVSAVSVQAAQPSAPHTVLRAGCVEDFSNVTEWQSGAAYHLRGGVAHHVNFLLVDGAWVREGTNVTTAMLQTNGTAGAASGTFEIRGSAFGDYDGSFTWGMSANGTATGQGVGDSAGRHLMVELLGTMPAGLPDPPADPCGYGRPPDFGFGYELWSVH